MKKTKTGVLGALALGVWVTITAVSASAQTVTRAVTSRSFGKEKPVGITTTFNRSDRTVHAYVSFARPFKCTMKSVWYAVKAKGLTSNQKLYEMSLKQNNYASGHFSLKNNSAWPVGTYRIDVYANAKKIRTLKFSAIRNKFHAV